MLSEKQEAPTFEFLEGWTPVFSSRDTPANIMSGHYDIAQELIPAVFIPTDSPHPWHLKSFHSSQNRDPSKHLGPAPGVGWAWQGGGCALGVLWEEPGNIRLALTQLPSHQDSSLPLPALRTHFPTNYFCNAWAPHCFHSAPAISANSEKAWKTPSNIMFISTGSATASLQLPARHKPPLICAALANRALLALPGWPLPLPPTSVYVTFPTHLQIW